MWYAELLEGHSVGFDVFVLCVFSTCDWSVPCLSCQGMWQSIPVVLLFLMAQSVSAARGTTQLFGHFSFQSGYCEGEDLQSSPLSRIQLQIELFTTLTAEEMIDELLNNEGEKNVTGQCPLNGNSSRPFEHQRSITKTFEQFHCEEFAFKFLPFKSVFW